MRLLAFVDEHRPVLVNQANTFLAGDVFGGDDLHDAGQLLRVARVDLQDFGARMLREHERAVDHARHFHVVDVILVAEHLVRAFVHQQRRADAARPIDFGEFPAATDFSGKFDGVENLRVAGAPAEMRAKPAGDFLAWHRRVLVKDPLGAHRDAGNAEAALESAGRDERSGDEITLRGP